MHMRCIAQQQACGGAASRAAPPSVPSSSSAGRVVACRAQAADVAAAPTSSRRHLLAIPSLVLGAQLVRPGGASAAPKAPKGYSAWEDAGDGYKFLYPFGWQEVAVQGPDVVFKDIVEPLESVSVTIANTEKKDITEYGNIEEVAETLAKEVLTPPNQEVKVVSTNQRETNGRTYYEFEFTSVNSRYTRHSLAVVAALNGKFYTLTTGANEKRWSKIKDRLQTSVRSFQFLY